MSSDRNRLPVLSSDVVLRRVSDSEYVVKHRKNGAYFRVGAVEHFLLQGLTQPQSKELLQTEYAERFAERLSTADLNDFLDMIREQGLLLGETPAANNSASSTVSPADDEDEFGSPSRQSWLYYRVRLFDPAPVLNVLEPRMRWAWTPTFFVLTLLVTAMASSLLWQQRGLFVTSFKAGLHWETLAIVWGCVVLATVLHEFAHGLTCRHFGGDVHEIGALMIFGTPSMYCDISDAWMIPSRLQRLCITLAGSISDLWVFALATGVWRLTVLDSLVNHVAWVLASVCGARVFLNLNPFLRLDGYYLASDWFEIPNLRSEANRYWKAHLRFWLWGAAKPPPHPRGRVLLAYGAMMWTFSVALLDTIALGLLQITHRQFGWWGVAVMAVVLMFVCRRVFKGLFSSEFLTMLTSRPHRTAAWAAGILAIVVGACVIPMERTTTGEFEVRPGVRFEVHTEVAGFVDRVQAVEGDAVRKDQIIMRLRVPDLDSLLVRKQSEIRESEAQLRKLRMGPRPEELAEQRERVNRAVAWRDLAQKDLQRAKYAHEQDLVRMDLEIQQFTTELEYEKVSLSNVERLHQLGAISGEARRSEYKKVSLIQAQLAQVSAQKRAREADGLRAAEAEVARREKDLADVQAALKLLEAGTRPEEIEAETARRARLAEEVAFLHDQLLNQDIKAPVEGVIATPRLQERTGQLIEKGGLVCVVADVRQLNVEITISEESAHGISPGQTIQLKARALPFDCFTARVSKVAPSAIMATGQQQSRLIVYCEVENDDGKLKPGMTGFARIQRGTHSMAQWGVTQCLRYLRTEFWW